MTTPVIHDAIRAAMKDIARIGIAKTSKASLGGWTVNYRGIEAAMNEMSAVLIRCAITVTPRYSALHLTERVKGNPEDGKATRFATVLGAFTFASAEDGSSVVCECYGEAMDSGDKAITKAQSVAFRTALFQQFVVPTMAIDPEADAQPEDESQKEAAPTAWPEDIFTARIQKWREALAAGKTHAEIIAFARSKFALSQAQENFINKLTPIQSAA